MRWCELLALTLSCCCCSCSSSWCRYRPNTSNWCTAISLPPHKSRRAVVVVVVVVVVVEWCLMSTSAHTVVVAANCSQSTDCGSSSTAVSLPLNNSRHIAVVIVVGTVLTKKHLYCGSMHWSHPDQNGKSIQEREIGLGGDTPSQPTKESRGVLSS